MKTLLIIQFKTPTSFFSAVYFNEENMNGGECREILDECNRVTIEG